MVPGHRPGDRCRQQGRHRQHPADQGPGMSSFDAAVIGSGPAGVTAALYLVRSGCSIILFEKMAAGGQILQTEALENYPGYPKGIKGLRAGRPVCRPSGRLAGDAQPGCCGKRQWRGRQFCRAGRWQGAQLPDGHRVPALIIASWGLLMKKESAGSWGLVLRPMRRQLLPQCAGRRRRRRQCCAGGIPLSGQAGFQSLSDPSP